MWHSIDDLSDEAEPAMQKAGKLNQEERATSQSPRGEQKLDMFDKYKEGQRTRGDMV